jgi:hypothetical protein
MQGTGKTLLAEITARIHTGRPVEVMPKPNHEEELRKRVTSHLMSGRPIALFDNITGRVNSGVLASVLTAATWSDRIMGGNRTAHLQNRCLWVCTGNNLALSSEIMRRTVMVRLDAGVPHPEYRGGFKHAKILDWVLTNRSKLVHAALVLVKSWVAAGRPVFTAIKMGSFESWAEIVGGILEVAGVPDFLGNLDTAAKGADFEAREWREFIGEWWQLRQDQPTHATLLTDLAAESLETCLDLTDESKRAVVLGVALAGKVGQAYEVPDVGVVFIRRADIRVLKPPPRGGYKVRPGWKLEKAS